MLCMSACRVKACCVAEAERDAQPGTHLCVELAAQARD